MASLSPPAHSTTKTAASFPPSSRLRRSNYLPNSLQLPWLKTGSKPRRALRAQKAVANNVPFGVGPTLAAGETGPSSSRVRPAKIKFPITLKSAVSLEVKRPKKSRSKKEKDREEEVLVIEGIEFDPNTSVKFDVVVNFEDYKEITPEHTEFAGSFVNMRHSPGHKKVKTRLRLEITELLEDLEADDDESILVTLVPRVGADVTIGGVNIEYD